MRVYVQLMMLAIIATGILLGCQGPGVQPDVTAANPIDNLASQPPTRSIALATAITYIRTSPTPGGVESEVYAQLKDQLIADLRARGISKLTATPPSGEGNQVDDLKLYGDQATGMTLRWTYKNLGDLNLDGLVSVSDLTPVGQFFGETCDGDNWPTACRADGNNDGAVTISDITSIGQNYLTYCAGYNVYGVDAFGGSEVMIGIIPPPPPPPSGSGEQGLVFSYAVPSPSHWYFQVRPVDGDGVEGIPSLISTPTITPGKVNLGADNYLASTVIDPAGGVIETDLGTADQHIKLTFPEGAVTTPLPLQVGTNNGTYFPHSGVLKSPIVCLDLVGDYSFGEPVTIEVKFDRFDLTKSIVPYIVDDDGATHLVDLLEMKSPEFTATFETSHLNGHLLWLVEDPATLQQEPDGGMRSTGFTPKYDGFAVDNGPGTWWSGSCGFGMAAFANWYHCAGKTWSEGNLRPRFRYRIDPPLYYYGQEVIAVRANAAIIHEFPTYWTNYIQPLIGVNQAQKFAAIVNGLANTGHPVLMRLYGSGGWYSVLATGYDADGIFIYDPYKPGQELYLHFDHATKTFDPYEGKLHFYYSGPGALWVQEPYQNILDDAKHEFDEHGLSRVEITSHTRGQEVPAGNLVISGTVDSTYLLAEKMLVMVQKEFTWVYVSPDGNFSANVPIEPGSNHFNFDTYSTAAGDVEVELPTGMVDSENFYLMGI